jgi:hypothetical protein
MMIYSKGAYIFEGETEVSVIHLAHELVESGYLFKEDIAFLQFHPVLRANLVAYTLPLHPITNLIPYHSLWHVMMLLILQALPLASLCGVCPHLAALPHQRVPVMLHHQRHLCLCE